MISICESCRFVFERTGEISAGPDCGKPDIREASADVKSDYNKNAGNPEGAAMQIRRRHGVGSLLLAVLLLPLLLYACATDGGQAEGYVVTRVVDGDTIIVDMDGTEERVRLIGVDTPESVHPDRARNVPYGAVASAFAKDALEGRRVDLEFDAQERDRYGRLLAYVYIDGEMFNKTLLSEGHAQISTYPPNVRYVDTFTQLQTDARERGAGLWAYYAEESPDAAADMPAGEDGALALAGERAGGESPDGGDAAGYIGNTGTKKFHLPSCRYVSTIKDSHLARFATREDAVAGGFDACKVCNP
jgi:micrococcal nuclease